MTQRLEAIESIQAIDDLSGPRIPRREVTLYRNQSEYQRESDAKVAVSDVMTVARGLAELYGETIEEEGVLSDPAMVARILGQLLRSIESFAWNSSSERAGHCGEAQ
jgi:hypothetical protein